jgi:anti-sigma regulatory factor (Ser/Thr protein kinase)/anti-anti-sigma regulatory factor
MSSEFGDPGDLSAVLDAYAAAPAVMLAFEGDEGDEMVLASANDAARAAFGELCEYGRPARELTPGVDSRSQRLMSSMADTAMTTGRTVTRSAVRVRVAEPGSQAFEVYWDLSVSPWYAEDGSVRGVLTHGVDVTEQTRARRQPTDVMHDVVTLQDALLPDWLPVFQGVEVAARYLMAHRETEAGGDWYDALGLPDGRVALLVGDVPLHGVVAAATMGRLRAVAQERLGSGAGLEGTVRALDGVARSAPEAGGATVCVAVLEPMSGRLEYCTAGHPPPLVVRAGGRRARHLPPSGAAPLATSGEVRIAVAHVGRGDLLVLYTNGLLARPGRTAAASTVELGQLAAGAAEPPIGTSESVADRVCRQTLEGMTVSTGYDDDIVLLAAEVVGPHPPLHLEVDADDDGVAPVLDSLATWMQSLHVRDLDHVVAQHAVDELLANVIEHAYPEDATARRVTVDAGLLATGALELRVVDHGRWRRVDHDSVRGNGLSMVRGLVDRLEVDGTDEGTTVTVRHRLSRPAPMLTGAPTGAALGDGAAERPFAMVQRDDRVLLTGSLDRSGTRRLKATLDDLAVTGRVVVDLSGLTRVPSAALQVLHAACREAADRGQEMVLYAPAGTPAQHVLETVCLPYVLTAPRTG